MSQSSPPHGSPAWNPYGVTPPAPAPKKRRLWPWIVLGIVIVLVALDVSGGSDETSTGSPAPAAGVPGGIDADTWAAQQDGAARARADVQREIEAAPSGPLTSFSDGTYEVGTGDGQVAPGKYRSPGGSTCYWARLKDGDGDLGDIIANNLGEGQALLTVKATDGLVEVRGCTLTKAA